MRNEQLLVLDESNQPRYSIHWQKNTQRIRNNPKGYCADDYWEYDFDNSYCNDFIIDRYDIFVFSKLEEYSHAIALHVLKRRRTSKVYFFDNLAECSELWGGYSDRVEFFTDWSQFPVDDSVLYITASEIVEDKTAVPVDSQHVFSSIGVMFFLLWGRSCQRAKRLLPRRRIALLDNDCSVGGLGDIIFIICNYAMQAESQGFTPVPDLTGEGCCQYYEKGKNVWEELFQPFSGVTLSSVSDASDDIVRASKEIDGWSMGSRMFNPLFYYVSQKETWEDYERAHTHLNMETWDFVIANAPVNLRFRLYKEMLVDVSNATVTYSGLKTNNYRILGVIVRGTDYSISASKSIHRSVYSCPWQKMLKETEKRLESGGFDFVFLATEDAVIFHEFEMKLGQKLISVKQPRVSHDFSKDGYVDLSVLLKREGATGITMARLYLTIIKCLSVCDSLLSSINAGTYRLATLYNNNRYESCEIIT